MKQVIMKNWSIFLSFLGLLHLQVFQVWILVWLFKTYRYW